MRTTLLILLALPGLALPASAQAGPEAEAVMVPIRQLFEGMRRHDSAMVHNAFAPEGRLVATDARSAAPTLRVILPAQFAAAVGRAQGDSWNEPIYDPEIRIDGGLATVWARYDFLIGSRWSHCGVDAFMLAKLGDGWLITQLADTRQTAGCTTPRAPRP